MTSVQDRLKLKRMLLHDTWTTREQLCLASSVLKSGDQNWMSVSRSLKSFVEKEALRPPDWFSQKSCAVQYAYLLENTDAPKRKKRESGETTGESIVRKLTQERIAELGQILESQRLEYKKLKAEIHFLKTNSVSEEKLQKMWLAIEQEGKEQEQKAKVWLAKRPLKQDVTFPQTISIGNQRKAVEGTIESQDALEGATEEEEKKNKGGRSPLLTSLLKSPSPTTQIQSSTPAAQVSSPTIASLLSSSPKVPNPQLPQTVSPQLHQLFSTALANATANASAGTTTNITPERPSAGAPTLSMLLEMPANTQRGPLPNLLTPPAVIHQQNVSIEVHVPSQPTATQVSIQNQVPAPEMPIITTPASNQATEGMVQIIDHIDDVIRKDIMADMMNKDEINEIIGDIEELIKEEITGSPQTLETPPRAPAIDSAPLSSPTKTQKETAISCSKPEPISERMAPRDVDEPVSLSNSPESEIAIEEIDSSTSNIAEIIGTVALESSELKVMSSVSAAPEPELTNLAKVQTETTLTDEKVVLKEDHVFETDSGSEDDCRNVEVKEETFVREVESIKPDTIEIAVSDAQTADAKEPVASVPDVTKEEVEDQGGTEVAASEREDSCDNAKGQKESFEESDNKDNAYVDQLEMRLAKITGEQQNTTASEVVSVISELTNDVPSTEDTEKSQDISLILEDDESTSHSCEEKKKMKEEHIIENTIDSTESLESFKEDTIGDVKEKDAVEVKGSSVKSHEESTEDRTLEIFTDDLKKEEMKDFSEDTTSSILQDIGVKEEQIDESAMADSSNKLTTSEETKPVKETVEIVNSENETAVKDAQASLKSEDLKTHPISREEIEIASIKQEPMEEAHIKEEKDENKKSIENQQLVKKESTESTGSAADDTGELDEEESSLSKLSGGRAMKTYSKKQNVTVDSEPENETSEGADYRAWKKAVLLVYNRLATHKYASVFLRPITEDQAPGYHSVVFRPMDLLTIKKNVENGTIRSTMHFQRDVMLMFQNAIMYNKHDTFVYKMAVSMQEECLQHMQILVQVTGEGTFRRETRTAASSSIDATESVVKRKRSHITPSPHDTESPRSKKRRKSEND